MLTTPPLAPKTLAALKELDICTLEDLQEIGAVRAFLLLKASGLTVPKAPYGNWMRWFQVWMSGIFPRRERRSWARH